MKKKRLNTILIGCIVLHLFATAKTEDNDNNSVTTANCIRIANYKDNKAAAISYTFDDGLRNQYLIAAPAMERHQITGTFFIIAGEVSATKEAAESKKPGAWGGITWDEIRSLAARGFEIGNHSYTHKDLTKIKDPAEIEMEIEKSANRIEKEIGVFPVSFCYPFNGRTEQVEKLALKRHAVARSFQQQIGKNDTMVEVLDLWIDELIRKEKWGVAMIHGLIDGFDPLNPEIFEDHLKYAQSKKEKIWIDTFGNIARYVQEAKATQIKIVKTAANSMTFVLDTDLDKKLFSVPLTVVITAPGVVGAQVRTTGVKSAPAVISDGEIVLSCIPNGNPVTVQWKNK